MIVYSPSANNLLKARHAVVPVYLKDPRVSLLDSGSTSSDIDRDANVILHDGARILNEIQLSTELDVQPVYTSLTTGIATVDADGYVTRVTDGIARIRCVVGPNVQIQKVPVSEVDPTDTVSFSSWRAGSLAKYATDRINALIDGVTPSSTTRAVFNGAYRNGSLFGDAYVEALTAIAKTINGSPWIAPTAITPRHVVSCWHAGDYTGCVGVWVDSEGNEHPRTLIASRVRVNSRDLNLYLLDSDLPEEIVPMPILPENAADFLPTLSPWNPGFRVPVLYVDRNNILNINTLGQIHTGGMGFVYPLVGSDYFSFADAPREGTSGKPLMLPYGATQLVMVSNYSGPSNGPSLHPVNWGAEIAALDASASVSTEHIPSVADFSAYDDFGA